MTNPKLTVAILVYNDVEALKHAIPKSVEVLNCLNISYEILITEDASTDGSYEVALDFSKDPHIRVNHSDMRRGKGGAINDALEDSSGEIFCFYDVDLSTDLRSLEELITNIQNGADIAIGSRLAPGSQVNRKGGRNTASIIYNKFVRLILKSEVHDHQCGFKAFNKERLKKIMPYVSAKKWTWDTEVLTVGQKWEYKIAEIPVVWTQTGKTNLCFHDVLDMGWSVLKFAVKIRSFPDKI